MQQLQEEETEGTPIAHWVCGDRSVTCRGPSPIAHIINFPLPSRLLTANLIQCDGLQPCHSTQACHLLESARNRIPDKSQLAADVN